MQEKFYKPYFLETHSDFKKIFYDTDFEKIRKLSKELQDVIKNMDLRQSRSQTLQIAKSVFDYESQQDFYIQYPHMYYDFRFGDTRICIGRKQYKKKDEYFVNCCGYNPPNEFLKDVGHFGFGSSDTLDGVKTLFCDIIRSFILGQLSALF